MIEKGLFLLALIVGNVLYVVLRSGDWETGIERTYFECVTLVTWWLAHAWWPKEGSDE